MGGIIFTTLQKFGRTREERENGWPHPRLSGRSNVIVIVDFSDRPREERLEAARSNNRFADRRIAQLEAQLTERPPVR
jgi:hypothetical protein